MFKTKVDRARRTGAAGGSNCIYDDVDELVLEVIGKKSPVVEGIGLPDSFGMSVNNQNLDCDLLTIDDSPYENLINVPDKSANIQKDNPPLCKGKGKRNLNIHYTKAYEDLKKRKLELEVRKLELDVWEKENLLGVEHCELTKDLQVINLKSLVMDDEGNIHVVDEDD